MSPASSASVSAPSSAGAPRTVRECSYDVLRQFGVDAIFGNPGSTELPMFRDFPPDFRYVLGLQEAVCVAMADGYAQARGGLGVVNLHSAAGVGNGMGNIYTAYKNRTPLVVIAGQQSRSILPLDAYLASERATELPRPYVKWSVEPARAADVPQAIAMACRRALQAPCGPVFVSVPADDWDQPGEAVPARQTSLIAGAEPQAFAALSQALAECERPVFVVGAEVDRAGAWELLVQLAERHSARVYNAPMSARAGFPEDHPLFGGFLPAVKAQIVPRLAEHDLVLVIGAPVFTYHVEGDGPHLPEGARLWQLTEDAEAAARSPVGDSLVGDVRLSLQALQATQPLKPRPAPSHWQRAPRVEARDPIEVAYLLQTLAELRSPEDIVVEEAPTARVVMHQHLPILRPRSFFTMASGGLGFSMPAAAGIAMARPDRKVIALIGDGSSMYSIQALWTAAQLGLNVCYIVVNNRRYGAMKRFGGVLGFPAGAVLPGTDLPGIDFVALAQGHGVPGERVQRSGELRAALQKALQSPGPCLLEVLVA